MDLEDLMVTHHHVGIYLMPTTELNISYSGLMFFPKCVSIGVHYSAVELNPCVL
jgi:hypothetical protein